mmetsp:Transcript_43039/g.84595  ORF Transcript_43039/g.84595 Transcript_43039/m.84595 type:complete len:94 (-) Transcript_43039:687-968(-)
MPKLPIQSSEIEPTSLSTSAMTSAHASKLLIEPPLVFNLMLELTLVVILLMVRSISQITPVTTEHAAMKRPNFVYDCWVSSHAIVSELTAPII